MSRLPLGTVVPVSNCTLLSLASVGSTLLFDEQPSNRVCYVLALLVVVVSTSSMFVFGDNVSMNTMSLSQDKDSPSENLIISTSTALFDLSDSPMKSKEIRSASARTTPVPNESVPEFLHCSRNFRIVNSLSVHSRSAQTQTRCFLRGAGDTGLCLSLIPGIYWCQPPIIMNDSCQLRR